MTRPINNINSPLTMIVGIGSRNRVKIAACKRAFRALNQKFSFFENNFKLVELETKILIPVMPLSRVDLMKGALQRALFVYKTVMANQEVIDYALGLEGGTFLETEDPENKRPVFLQSWVYAYNGQQGFFGSSPALTIPPSIVTALYEQKRELGEIIDHFSGQREVSLNQGAFGVLTENLITREDSFYFACINAMIPFLNTKHYR